MFPLFFRPVVSAAISRSASDGYRLRGRHTGRHHRLPLLYHVAEKRRARGARHEPVLQYTETHNDDDDGKGMKAALGSKLYSSSGE